MKSKATGMRRLVVCAALFVGMLAPAAFSGQASSEDDRITDQVRMRLAGDVDVKGGALEVTVKEGEVMIKGRVDTEKGKSKATKLAKKVKGVKSVDNELSVGPPV